LAGSGKKGHRDAKGKEAEFRGPVGIDVDQHGTLYVTDISNHTIRKITADGDVSTFAGRTGVQGFKNGPQHEATFSYPSRLAIHPSGTVYITDGGNKCIRSIAKDGMVSTLAGNGTGGFKDGLGEETEFRCPAGITLNKQQHPTFLPSSSSPRQEQNNMGTTTIEMYVSDQFNHSIRRITHSSHSPRGTYHATAAAAVCTIAGNGQRGCVDGQGEEARMYNPKGITLGSDGTLYVADWKNNSIRMLNVTQGIVEMLHGFHESVDGDEMEVREEATFREPVGVYICDGYLYVTERGGSIRVVDIRARECGEKINDNKGDINHAIHPSTTEKVEEADIKRESESNSSRLEEEIVALQKVKDEMLSEIKRHENEVALLKKEKEEEMERSEQLERGLEQKIVALKNDKSEMLVEMERKEEEVMRLLTLQKDEEEEKMCQLSSGRRTPVMGGGALERQPIEEEIVLVSAIREVSAKMLEDKKFGAVTSLGELNKHEDDETLELARMYVDLVQNAVRMAEDKERKAQEEKLFEEKSDEEDANSNNSNRRLKKQKFWWLNLVTWCGSSEEKMDRERKQGFAQESVTKEKKVKPQDADSSDTASSSKKYCDLGDADSSADSWGKK